jgi:hypothetical protein
VRVRRHWRTFVPRTPFRSADRARLFCLASVYDLREALGLNVIPEQRSLRAPPVTFEAIRPFPVVLLVPPGLNDNIFPWGVHIIRDYVLNRVQEPLSVEIVRLDYDPNLVSLRARHDEMITALLKDTPFRYQMPLTQLTFFGAMGEAAVEPARREKLISRWTASRLRSRFGEQLRQLKVEYEELLVRRLRAVPAAPGVRLWGISVCERTEFTALVLANLVKKTFPEAKILFGGNAIRPDNADLFIKHTPCLDGVVIGPGEEVLETYIGRMMRGEALENVRGLRTRTSRGAAETAEIAPSPHKISLTQRSKLEVEFYKDAACPTYFWDGSAAKTISYVHRDERQRTRLRLYTQRGCSHGKCTFCELLDRAWYFPVPFEGIAGQISATLQEMMSQLDAERFDGPVQIYVDSSDMDMPFLKGLLAHLTANPPKIPIVLTFWVRVATVNSEVAEWLWKFGRLQTVRCVFVANVESFDLQALKRMRKGHSALKGVEVLKALRDCGGTVASCYFFDFPGRSYEDVESEYNILSRVLHLLTFPSTITEPQFYWAGDADIIANEPEKYGTANRREVVDVWTKAAFGFSPKRSMEYSQPFGWRPGVLIGYLFHEFINNLSGGKPVRLRYLMFWLASKLTRRPAFLKLWQCAMYVFQTPCFGFQQQADCFSRDVDPKVRFGLERRPHGASRLYIWNGVLFKEYASPDLNDKLTLVLSQHELQVLRFLYWVRRRDEVFAHFAGQIEEAELRDILARHEELGVLIAQGSSLVCCANDPDYFAYTASPEEQTAMASTA